MTRADLLAVLCALILLPFLYMHFWGRPVYGEYVVIRAAGQPPLSVPLHHNRRLEVDGPLGRSVIVIEDARVRFIESPCQNKQCILAGWLDDNGEVAACLPNGITVQVQGRDARFDALNF